MSTIYRGEERSRADNWVNSCNLEKDHSTFKIQGTFKTTTTKWTSTALIFASRVHQISKLGATDRVSYLGHSHLLGQNWESLL